MPDFRRISRIRLGAVVVACACVAGAQAQVAVPPPVEVAPLPAVTLPAPPQPAPSAASAADGSGGAIQWRCGGIGSDESTAMRAAMKVHPLSLLFARADGAYLADVQVEIRAETAGGPAQSLRASGPVCLLTLPPGRYAVDASLGGQRQSRGVDVGGEPRTLDFRF